MIVELPAPPFAVPVRFLDVDPEVLAREEQGQQSLLPFTWLLPVGRDEAALAECLM